MTAKTERAAQRPRKLRRANPRGPIVARPSKDQREKVAALFDDLICRVYAIGDLVNPSMLLTDDPSERLIGHLVAHVANALHETRKALLVGADLPPPPRQERSAHLDRAAAMVLREWSAKGLATEDVGHALAYCSTLVARALDTAEAHP